MRTCLALAILAAALLAVGCGNSDVGTVTGTVTVNGEPAQVGSIAFIPVDGKASTAGAEIKDGKYTAEVPVGMCKVELRVSKVVGQKKLYDTPDSPVQPILAEVLPPQYNNETTLTLEVKPGTNEKDYHVEVKQ